MTIHDSLERRVKDLGPSMSESAHPDSPEWTAKLLSEPTLLFSHGQALEDPRDGITLFGPFDVSLGRPITWGCVGTADGIRRAAAFVSGLQGVVANPDAERARPFFPGFEAAFRVKIGETPIVQATISEQELMEAVNIDDPHQRVYSTVGLYTDAILDLNRTADHRPDVWLVVVPEVVYTNCRPKSRLAANQRRRAPYRFSKKSATELIDQRPLFEEELDQARPYYFDVDFHNQLKARLLTAQVTTQVVREPKIAPDDFADPSGRRSQDVAGMESSIAWNIATALYYKAGFRPWKLASTRDHVCYVGLVFKQISASKDRRTACCAAQMFLDSGDGLVFRGAVGPWFSERRGDYHLSRRAAGQLMRMCLDGYKQSNGGELPREIFLHGRVSFQADEWDGITDALPEGVSAVGVRIRRSPSLKLYRLGSHPVLRGTAVFLSETRGFLWSNGMIPRIGTYDGREVPNPLEVTITQGQADLSQVMKDILSLTKLNYNTCKHSDGRPVTLRFADDVGDILTAGPIQEDAEPPLPFKFYI